VTVVSAESSFRLPWHRDVLGDPYDSEVGENVALLEMVFMSETWGSSCERGSREGKNSGRAHVE
jgi:hypothetical protein